MLFMTGCSDDDFSGSSPHPVLLDSGSGNLPPRPPSSTKSAPGNRATTPGMKLIASYIGICLCFQNFVTFEALNESVLIIFVQAYQPGSRLLLRRENYLLQRRRLLLGEAQARFRQIPRPHLTGPLP